MFKRKRGLNQMEISRSEKMNAKVKAYELALAVRHFCDGENVDEKAKDIYKWLMED